MLVNVVRLARVLTLVAQVSGSEAATPVHARRGSPSHTPLIERVDEICAALLAYEHLELPEPQRSWLKAQYAEVVPVVVADALIAVDLGEPVSAACLQRVRDIAARHAAERVSLNVALRGALPALRVFAAAVRDAGPAPRVLTLMHRASVVAQELGSAWVEGWFQAKRSPSAVAEGFALEPQERVIIELVAEGWSNARIATVMHYSRQAVAWYLSRLMRRWRVSNRAALVSAAFTRGVLVVDGRPEVPGQGSVPRGIDA